MQRFRFLIHCSTQSSDESPYKTCTVVVPYSRAGFSYSHPSVPDDSVGSHLGPPICPQIRDICQSQIQTLMPTINGTGRNASSAIQHISSSQNSFERLALLSTSSHAQPNDSEITVLKDLLVPKRLELALSVAYRLLGLCGTEWETMMDLSSNTDIAYNQLDGEERRNGAWSMYFMRTYPADIPRSAQRNDMRRMIRQPSLWKLLLILLDICFERRVDRTRSHRTANLNNAEATFYGRVSEISWGNPQDIGTRLGVHFQKAVSDCWYYSTQTCSAETLTQEKLKIIAHIRTQIEENRRIGSTSS